MANTTWIVVANASCARVYANHGPKKGLTLIKELEHPESRQKGMDLVTDRAGVASVGHGTRQAQVDPKTHEARTFAHELARELYQGRVTAKYDRAILVAPPSFMGLINEKLDNPTAQMVSDRFEKDYTKYNERELAGQLQSCIYL
ncbi:MAG: host attachment protein [Pseudomonadota bacterium]|jgi:protein required for attachment to host cells